MQNITTQPAEPIRQPIRSEAGDAEARATRHAAEDTALAAYSPPAADMPLLSDIIKLLGRPRKASDTTVGMVEEAIDSLLAQGTPAATDKAVILYQQHSRLIENGRAVGYSGDMSQVEERHQKVRSTRHRGQSSQPLHAGITIYRHDSDGTVHEINTPKASDLYAPSSKLQASRAAFVKQAAEKRTASRKPAAPKNSGLLARVKALASS